MTETARNWAVLTINQNIKQMETFKCSVCQQTKPVHKEGGTGYGIDINKNKVCYACIGDQDKKELEQAKPGDKFLLYLTNDNGKWQVTNWPGTFKASAYVRTGRHNIAGNRYDAYFTVNGNSFHGVTYGDNTQICHVKRVKG